MKQIFIFCDGGLANRIGCLVSGIALAELLDLEYTILWPGNNRCGALFEDIFVPQCIALQVRLQELVPYQRHLRPWLHEDDCGFIGTFTQMRAISGIDELKTMYAADEKSIIFCDNSFLPWLPPELVDRSLNKLTFHPDIVDRAARLLLEHSPGPYFGIHLRATDFVVPPPVDKMLSVVAANPQFTFFVCSDDLDIERKFTAFPNVFVHTKNAYVEKYTSGTWRGDFLDSDGIPYTGNINRTSQSVIDACVDLFLLAISTPITTSQSSFLALSEKLKTSGLVERHLSDRARNPGI